MKKHSITLRKITNDHDRRYDSTVGFLLYYLFQKTL